MAEAPIMPFATDAFVADTTGLDDAETGAYLMLLFTLWRMPDGTLPYDHKVLARHARCDPGSWPARWDAIKHYFIIKDGLITQGRLTRDRAKVRAKIEKARQNGRKGGSSKPRENNDNQASGTNPLKQNASEMEADCKLTINHEPEPIDSETIVSGEQVAVSDDASLVVQPDPAKQLFDTGVAFLGRKGVAEKQARSVIGKLRSRLNGSATDALWIVQQAIVQDVTEPVAYFEAMMRERAPGRSPLMEAMLERARAPH